MLITDVTKPKQIAAVVDLADNIWREHYIPIIGAEQVDYMLKKYQSAEAVRRQIDFEGYRYFLFSDGPRPIGYASVQVRKNHLFVSKIYLLDSLRGRGLGKKAIFFLVDLAKSMGLEALELTVNKYNPSIAAYEKMGFEKVDDVVVDIGNGFVMDDYVMQKRV